MSPRPVGGESRAHTSFWARPLAATIHVSRLLSKGAPDRLGGAGGIRRRAAPAGSRRVLPARAPVRVRSGIRA
jgi:hypothetical protein